MDKTAQMNQAINIIMWILGIGLVVFIRWSMWLDKRRAAQQRTFPPSPEATGEKKEKGDGDKAARNAAAPAAPEKAAPEKAAQVIAPTPVAAPLPESAAQVAQLAQSDYGRARVMTADDLDIPARSTAPRFQPSLPKAPAIMQTEQILDLLNKQPNTNPHVGAYGPTRVGKTTFLQGLLILRPDKFVIFDPKPAEFGEVKWGGLPFFKIDDDATYTSIKAGLLGVRAEINRRLVAMQHGPLEPLTIVLDEYKLLFRVCGDVASDVYVTVSDIGAQLKMRLMVASTTDRVQGLGIAGIGDTKDNFLDVKFDRQKVARMEWDGTVYTLETDDIRRAAGDRLLADRVWTPPAPESEQQETPVAWTQDHVKVAMWLSDNPSISQAEVGRRLWPQSDGSGSYNVRAKAIMSQVVRVLEQAESAITSH